MLVSETEEDPIAARAGRTLVGQAFDVVAGDRAVMRRRGGGRRPPE